MGRGIRWIGFLCTVVLTGVWGSGCVWCMWVEVGRLHVYGLTWVGHRVAVVGRLSRWMRCGEGWFAERRDLPDRDVIYFVDPRKIRREGSRWVVVTDSVWSPVRGFPEAQEVSRSPDGDWWLTVPSGIYTDLVRYDSLFVMEKEVIPGGRLPAFRGDTLVYVVRTDTTDRVMLRSGGKDTVLFEVREHLRRVEVGPDGRIYGAFQYDSSGWGYVFRWEGDSMRFFPEGYDLSFLEDTLVVFTSRGWLLLDTAFAVLDTIPSPPGQGEERFVTLCDEESEGRWDIGPWGALRCLPSGNFFKGLVEICGSNPREGWVCADSVHLHDVSVYEPPHPPI